MAGYILAPVNILDDEQALVDWACVDDDRQRVQKLKKLFSGRTAELGILIHL